MTRQPLACLVICFVILVHPLSGLAFETDQFNLPPEPLADIGDEVSEHVVLGLRVAAAKVNADIESSMMCLDSSPARSIRCASQREELNKLAYLRTRDAIAAEVYKQLGDGSIFVSKFGKWMNSNTFQSQPSSYKTGYFTSIYIALPTDYITISPTVKLYGTEFGSDKLDHFFQQGYGYYKIRAEALAGGSTPEQAAAKAVKWGQKTERTYFGLLISGVYSNADLYANYAGMKFYEGLTQPLKIGNADRPAIAYLQNGVWKINEDAVSNGTTIKPFLSEHLNEALNPSGYAWTISPSVRYMVRKYSCPEWRRTYPALTPAELNNKAADLELWNDEDYGNMPKGRLIKIGDECYTNKASAE